MQKERYQSQISICHTEVFLTFLRLAAKHQSYLKGFEVAASKFNLKCPLTSMASKTALPNILMVASNQCICSKDWWEL